MAKYTLYIFTYDRERYHTGEVKPYHWSFFIEKESVGSSRLGIEHQLRGMPGSFYYPGPENVELEKLQPRKNELDVGQLDSSELAEIHDILKLIRIDKVESSGWNCQDWTLDAMAKLQERGVVYDYITKEQVRNWLKEDI